jgi:hypothetical protein
MSRVYIIKIKINDNSNMIEAFLELSKNTNDHPFIQVKTSDNQVLLYKYISNDFAQVSFSTVGDNYSCLINYFDKNKVKYNTTFHFDSQSASAFTDFKQKLTEMINQKVETIYYPNEHLYYFGETIVDKDNMKIPHGLGTIHYDSDISKVKYTGEFENGNYDGAGEFFSYDNKISIKANNISNGIPTQKGVLLINLKVNPESFDIDFNYIFESFKLVEKKDKQYFVKSDFFVKKIADLYWSRVESIESTIFREQSVKDKQQEIWNQLQEINNKIDILLLQSKKLGSKSSSTSDSYVLTPVFIVILISIFFGYYKIKTIFIP